MERIPTENWPVSQSEKKKKSLSLIMDIFYQQIRLTAKFQGCSPHLSHLHPHLKSGIVCFTVYQCHRDKFLSNYCTCWMNEATVSLSFKRGRKFTSPALTADQADNRLQCRPIWSYSGWQKPNMPLALPFEKKSLSSPGLEEDTEPAFVYRSSS